MAPCPRTRPSTRPSKTPQSGRESATVPPPRRKRLNYSRTSIACDPCRHRKIRCIPAKRDPQNRCFDCIRLGKKCVYTEVQNGREIDASTHTDPHTDSPVLQDAREGIEELGSGSRSGSGNNGGKSASPGVQSVRREDVSYPFLYNPVEEMTHPLVQNTGNSVRGGDVNSIRREMASMDAAHLQLQNMREVYNTYSVGRRLRGMDNAYAGGQNTRGIDNAYLAGQRISEVDNAYSAGQRTSGVDNAYAVGQNTRGIDNAYSAGQRISGMDNPSYSAEQSTSGTNNPYSAERSTNNTYPMAQNTVEMDNAYPVGQNAAEVDTTAYSMMQNTEPPSYPVVQNTMEMTTPTIQGPWTMENPNQSTWGINGSGSAGANRAFTEDDIYHIFSYMA